MKLGYFTMPVHPLGRDWQTTLQEDRQAIIFADELGFHDAFVGEHLTDACENITKSMLFLATLAPVTKQIRLASGTSNLSQSHPVLVAAHAAMLDHLTGGRFIFGISPGASAKSSFKVRAPDSASMPRSSGRTIAKPVRPASEGSDSRPR